MAKVEKQGKKKRKNRVTSKRWEKYKSDSDSVTRTNKFCPRCGLGIFLAQSKDRLFCGKCHYTEFVK